MHVNFNQHLLELSWDVLQPTLWQIFTPVEASRSKDISFFSRQTFFNFFPPRGGKWLRRKGGGISSCGLFKRPGSMPNDPLDFNKRKVIALPVLKKSSENRLFNFLLLIFFLIIVVSIRLGYFMVWIFLPDIEFASFQLDNLSLLIV